MNYTNGEHYLLNTAPFYKRRYTVDGDLVIGCKIGCKFCYYRWIEGTSDLIGTGKTKTISTPERMVEFITNSKIIRKDKDILMLSARSDASIQIKQIGQFMKILPYKNPVYILHRGYFSEKTLEYVEDPRVVYCTTLTPMGFDMGWTPIKEELQIEGLKKLIRNGIPTNRISVEVGPMNEITVDKGIEIMKKLRDLGFEFLTFRGVSIGSFNVDPNEDKLKEIKFETNQEENAPEGHTYYKIKNYLTKEIEDKIFHTFTDIRLHRFTGSLYRDEFGIDIAYNRHNRYRRELGTFAKVDIDKLKNYIETFGYSVNNIREEIDGYHIETDNYLTEDIAMTVGAEFNTSVIFDKYRISPTMEDIEFYKHNRIFDI